MGLLDDFKRQLESDRSEETYDIEVPTDYEMNEEEYEQYKKEVDSLRQQMYEELPKEMAETKVVNPSYPNELVMKVNTGKINEIMTRDDYFFTESVLETFDVGFVSNENGSIFVRHAKCPYCHEEFTSKTPPMYNPWSLKPISAQECPNCGRTFRTEHSYPRLMVTDNKNNEQILFCD